MKTTVWIVLTVIVLVMGFLAGYKLSYRTGIQPGYFEAAEAGGYGGGGGVAEGLDKTAQEYYKNLLKQEE